MNPSQHWSHWVARSIEGSAPFAIERYAVLAWNILRRLFPNAGAAILMPNHIHLALPPEEEKVLERLGGVLGAVSAVILREYPHSFFDWQPIPPCTRIADEKHLLRTLRYIALNPIRAKITGDPLTWRWSSFREVVGASANYWPGPTHAWSRCMKTGLQVRFHDYVTSDSDVDISARKRPNRPATRSEIPIYDLVSIAQATVVAVQVPTSALKKSAAARRYFCWLARTVGWKYAEPLAVFCGMSKRNVQWHWGQPAPDEKALQAGLLVLGEPRLRHGVVFPTDEKTPTPSPQG